MKLPHRHHLVATVFPASMLEVVRRQSQAQADRHPQELVFLTGNQPVTARRVRLVAEEFSRSGKTVRVIRTL
jgi:hypothetical protein